MNLCISNIAWNPKTEDSEVAQLLAHLGVDKIEVAPTKIWPEPLLVSDEELRTYRNYWKNMGFEIAALQSLLFNKSDLKIFDSKSANTSTLNYLVGIVGVAEKLGASVLVFGSPKNRTLSGRTTKEARSIAIDFFLQLGDFSSKHNVKFCIEANPPQYGCDFITTSNEAFALVNEVGSEGFGLHLDIAAMHLAGEPVLDHLKQFAPHAEHIHFSAPLLGSVDQSVGLPYLEAIQVLKDVGYDRCISVEMLNQNGKMATLTQIENTIRYLKIR